MFSKIKTRSIALVYIYIYIYIVDMKTVLIQLDEPTFAALNRVANPVNRKRSEFIRRAIKAAIRQAEFDSIREGYRKKPDSAADADDWSNPEDFRL
jgi:hypothetical protein